MPFKFSFDDKICVQCGICGDSCAIDSLDFTRPLHANIEDTKTDTNDARFMTEYPMQISKCTGCMICQNECPVACITILETTKEPAYKPAQGPMLEQRPAEGEFQLSRYTHVRPYGIKTKDPWGKEYFYRPLRRKSRTHTWENSEDMK